MVGHVACEGALQHWREKGVVVTDVTESHGCVLRRWYLLVVVGSVVGMFAGCHCREAPAPRGAACPPSSLAPAPACEAPSSAPAPDVPTNGLASAAVGDDVGHNGLSPGALAGPLQQLLLQLSARALTPALLTSDPAWRSLLGQPYAPDLVQYIVSCALDPDEQVDLPPDWEELAATRHRFACGFPGQLGLCSQSYQTWAARQSPAPPSETTWRAQAATPACLERVSACVLARVNAVEARVSISIRGDGTTLLPKVRVQTQFRENHGTPIQSFQRCDQVCLRGDPVRRNCDWEPRYVGQCMRAPGDGPRTVHLAITPGAAVRVRICQGLYGCDDTDPGLGAGAATAPVFAHGRLVEFPTPYGGQMIYQGSPTGGAAIEFPCPDNGPHVPGPGGSLVRTGYYSVMLGTLDPAVPVAAGADVTLAPTAGAPVGTHDTYPAPERQVFTYREGGFYGTIFPSAVQPAPPAPDNKFACASDLWSFDVATTEDRLCAGPMGSVLPGGCFGRVPGQCDVPNTPGSCAAAATQPKVYDACRGGPHDWQRPYTTYLSHPCDLFATDEACTRYLKDAKEIAVRRMPPAQKPDPQRQAPALPRPNER